MSVTRVVGFAAVVMVLGIAPGMATKGPYEPGIWEGPSVASLPIAGSGACVALADAGVQGTTAIY